jgi:hypothetical protein
MISVNYNCGYQSFSENSLKKALKVAAAITSGKKKFVWGDMRWTSASWLTIRRTS